MASVSSQEDDFVASSEADVDCWERVEEPSHYKLSIESFSSLDKMLSECGIQYYESKIFEASGYKWKFLLYPNGDATRNSRGHISVYLRIEDTAALPLDWEICTDSKFFRLDQKRNKYLVIQDGISRFNHLKTENGIAKLVSRVMFEDDANGYLVNDKCVFGVEVFVVDSKFVGENLSKSVNVDETFTWKISNYSNLSSNVLSSEFTAYSYQWKFKLYPLGVDPMPYGANLGLYLELADNQIPCAGLLVHFVLGILNQRSENHKMSQSCECFAPKSTRGWDNFMPVADLLNGAEGYMVDNSIIIQAQIKNVSTIYSPYSTE